MLLQKIVEAAGRLRSAGQAAIALGVLNHLDVSARHVTRLTAQIGAELAARRDHEAEQHRRRQLSLRVSVPSAVAVVEVDGGRLSTRQPGCGQGIHHVQPKEDKLACLVSMAGQEHDHDPQPEPPPSLPERTGPAEPWVGAPEPLLRTCVASMATSRRFAPLVAAEAQACDFYRARCRAFVADGLKYNWEIWKGYFRDFEPIVDFLHVACYVYLSAFASGGTEADRWSRYVRWLRACWQGRVREVLVELAEAGGRLGPIGAGEEVNDDDPREVVRRGLGWFRNNQGRMDYGRYRREGLPVTSSLVESLVGQFNERVKGPHKHWNRPEGAERILEVRAAVLSEDDRLARHFAQRAGNPYRRKAG